jgi:TetR/AcrR family transcriptional regulator
MEPDKTAKQEPDTEKKILEAAGKVFMKKGRLGASMQDIADEAGINRTLLHYYFRSKENLFDRIFSKVLAKTFPAMVVGFASDRPFMEKIQVFVDTYTDLLNENPYLPVFVLQEISLNPERLAGIIRQNGLDPDLALKSLAMEMESCGIVGMDPRHLVANMLGMVLFPYIGRALFQKVAFKDDAEAYEAFLEDRREKVPKFISRAMHGPDSSGK